MPFGNIGFCIAGMNNDVVSALQSVDTLLQKVRCAGTNKIMLRST